MKSSKNLYALCRANNNSTPKIFAKREWRERANPPYTWASSDENYLKSISGSVSYCVAILRTTPHWSVRMTSCNSRMLTREQQIKITFAAWVRTNNKFQIITMGLKDSLSYFILSCFRSLADCLKARSTLTCVSDNNLMNCLIVTNFNGKVISQKSERRISRDK